MTGSYQDDYLMRQVKAIAAMLARILGLRTSGQTVEAKAELDNAYDQLLGPQSDLLRRLDAHSAAALLASPDAILALAQLTNEEATQHQDAAQSAALRLRALELGIEAAQRGDRSDANRTFLASVAPTVDRARLTRQQQEFLDGQGNAR